MFRFGSDIWLHKELRSKQEHHVIYLHMSKHWRHIRTISWGWYLKFYMHAACICLLLRNMETMKNNMLYLIFLQVSYCENDVDCRRLLQLIHFGEKFDPSLCARTCDNCLKESGWVEKDVTNIARQLVSVQMCPFQMHWDISLCEPKLLFCCFFRLS